MRDGYCEKGLELYFEDKWAAAVAGALDGIEQGVRMANANSRAEFVAPNTIEVTISTKGGINLETVCRITRSPDGKLQVEHLTDHKG